jgi:hypothetical protein
VGAAHRVARTTPDGVIERQEAGMIRILIVISAVVLVGGSGAEAAARKGTKAAGWQTAAVAARPAAPARPVWASAHECYTDDGYGRFLPCNAACGR